MGKKAKHKWPQMNTDERGEAKTRISKKEGIMGVCDGCGRDDGGGAMRTIATGTFTQLGGPKPAFAAILTRFVQINDVFECGAQFAYVPETNNLYATYTSRGLRRPRVDSPG
jgi:hypothetical protein